MPDRSWPTHVGLSLLWGMSLVVGNAVVGGFGWAAAAVVGSFVVAVAVVPAAMLEGMSLRLNQTPGELVTFGAAVAVQNTCLCFALANLGLAQTAVVLISASLFATVVGQVWGVDRITGAAAGGLGIGLLGLLLVIVFPADGHSWTFITGVLACLLCALAAGFCTKYSATRFRGRPVPLAVGHLFAAAVSFPLALLAGQLATVPGWAYVALVLFGIGVAVAASRLNARCPSAARELHTGRVTAGGMVLAVVVGSVFLGDSLAGGQIVGMLMLVAGSALVLQLLPGQAAVRLRP